MKSLDQINKKFFQVIDSNFNKEFAVDGTVIAIKPLNVVDLPVKPLNVVDLPVKQKNGENASSGEYSFIIDSDGYVLNCVTHIGSSTLNVGDMIRIKGKLIADKTKLGSVYVMVTLFFHISDNIRLEAPIQEYIELRERLNDSDNIKLQKKINIMHQKKMPQIITNVGVIVMESHKFALDTFKIQFQEKCTGNLFIYNVPDSITTNNDNGTKQNKFIDGLDYFTSKNNIDVICILTDTLTLDQTLALSSREMVNKMEKYTKNNSYIVAVSQCNNHVKNLDCISYYLCSLLTNKRFDSIYSCVNSISSVQINYKKKITSSITSGISELASMIQLYQHNVMKFELDVVRLNPSYMSFQNEVKSSGNNLNPFDQLESLLINRLNHEKDKLTQIELAITTPLAFLYNAPRTKKAMVVYEGIKNKEITVIHTPNSSQTIVNNSEQYISSVDTSKPIPIQQQIILPQEPVLVQEPILVQKSAPIQEVIPVQEPVPIQEVIPVQIPDPIPVKEVVPVQKPDPVPLQEVIPVQKVNYINLEEDDDLDSLDEDYCDF